MRRMGKQASNDQEDNVKISDYKQGSTSLGEDKADKTSQGSKGRWEMASSVILHSPMSNRSDLV